LTLDGSLGEGGGQILRTALALSLCLGKPFRIERVRANRRPPGLRPQHLTAVRAAAEISGARVDGAEVGASSLEFHPGPVHPGNYRFATGTAGSTTLVLQTVLPPLALAASASQLRIEGGTHNPLAPPFEFVAESFLPLIARMGPSVDLTLDRPGFYPAGGGVIRAAIKPARRLRPLRLLERGELLDRQATALLCHLPEHIARRELDVLSGALGWPSEHLHIRRESAALGPGNALGISLAYEQVTAHFSGIGQRGLPAEEVAGRACAQAWTFVQSDVPVDPHLADQLLLWVALAGEGSYRTLAPTTHLTTNADTIRRFLPCHIDIAPEGRGTWRVAVSSAGPRGGQRMGLGEDNER